MKKHDRELIKLIIIILRIQYGCCLVLLQPYIRELKQRQRH